MGAFERQNISNQNFKKGQHIVAGNISYNNGNLL